MFSGKSKNNSSIFIVLFTARIRQGEVVEKNKTLFSLTKQRNEPEVTI